MSLLGYVCHFFARTFFSVGYEVAAVEFAQLLYGRLNKIIIKLVNAQSRTHAYVHTEMHVAAAPH